MACSTATILANAESHRTELKLYFKLWGLSILAGIIQSIGVIFSKFLILEADTLHTFIDGSTHGIGMLVVWLVIMRQRWTEEWIRDIGNAVVTLFFFLAAYHIVTEVIDRMNNPVTVSPLSLWIAGGMGLVINLYQQRLLQERGYGEHTTTHDALHRHVEGDIALSWVALGGGLGAMFTQNSGVDTFLSCCAALYLYGLGIETVADIRFLWRPIWRLRQLTL